MTRYFTTFFGVVFFAATAFAGGDARSYKSPLVEQPVDESVETPWAPMPDWSTMRPGVGTYTTLSGFYDYQANWGAVQHIRVNPANGNIHVMYFTSGDSITPGGALRSTVYAFSTNQGATWNNFNNLRIPNRRSGFATLDLGRGPIAGAAVVANHNDPGSGLASIAYVDFPEGTGAFAELTTVTPLGSDEPIWPAIASASDGSLIVGSSRNAGNTNHRTRTPDYVNWTPWAQFPGINQGGGTNPVVANETGRVGYLINTSNGSSGVYWLESTNNGASWPGTATEIHGLQRIAQAETLAAYVHSDIVYDGNNPLIVMTEYNASTGLQPRITFWSAATGYVEAVPWVPGRFIDDIARDQRFHSLSLGWPAIGMSGSTIVVAFQVFQADLDPRGYNYSDLWYVTSANGGVTWSSPVNLTNTATMDERYPSVSKWNPPGTMNLVFQEKPRSGLFAFPGDADTVRASQVYLRVQLSDVEESREVPRRFALSQNYPNPFNPSTTITYTVAEQAHVKLSVFDVLGQEVASLVNDVKEAGLYEVSFSATNLTSGVYFYTLKAGSFSETRKMVLLK